MKYPVALAADIPAGAVMGTRLHGEEIAVWREPGGRVHVWRDLCPHRGMRLSLGFLRDGSLACPYHGWRFEPSGRCVSIPAHPRAVPPASVSVRRYHAAEALGIIWVTDEVLGTDEIWGTDEHPLPDADVTPVRSVTIRRPAATVIGALTTRGFSADALGFRTDSALYAVQPVEDQVTAVHIVHLGAASVSALVALAGDAAGLRAQLETAVGARA